MANKSKLKEAGDDTAKAEESATKIFAKSGYPKTAGGNIKLILNFLFNFLS